MRLTSGKRRLRDAGSALVLGAFERIDPMFFFPIADDDRELYKPCYVTWALLIANVLVFFYQLASPEMTYGYSAVPAEISSGEDMVDLIRIEMEDGSGSRRDSPRAGAGAHFTSPS